MSHSVRAYARHRGVSHRSVQKAVAAQRLSASVVFEAGRARIVDFALADREWAANTSRLVVAKHDAVVPTLPPHCWSVCLLAGLVVLAWRSGPDDDEAWRLGSMTRDTARLLGERLMSVAAQ